MSVSATGVTTGLNGPDNQSFNPLYTSASLSDSAGNLLFAIDGNKIIDKNLAIMPALANINFNAYYGRMLIQKVPGSKKYYVFYTKANAVTPNSTWTLKYAIVDLSLNNGNGDVIIYDQVIDTSLSPGYTLVQQDNTQDAWLVTHRAVTDSFFSYKITATGINTTPVTSRAGTHVSPVNYIFKDLKTSSDGKMIGGSSYKDYSGDFANAVQFLEVFYFNAGDGRLTNKVRSTRIGTYFYGYQSVEFSPDNRLLYGGLVQRIDGLQPCGFSSGAVVQYNLCYTDSIEFSRYAMVIAKDFVRCYPWVSWGQIQMGADKRIHMPYTGLQVCTIDKPNRIGSRSDFVFNSYQQPVPNYGYVVTPGIHHKLLEKAIKNNIVYDGGCFPFPVQFKVTNDTILNIIWNFGDPASGNNTATTATTTHIFSASGIYTVTATLYNSQGKFIERISELVEVKDPNQRILSDYPKDTSFCSGNSLEIRLNVVNGIFHWYQLTANGEIYNSIISDSNNIGSSGTWYVEMRQNDCNGCRMLDSIKVTVLPRPDFYLGDDRTLCQGDSIQLNVYDPTAAYTWSTGSTTQSIWVRQGGIYWLEGEYDNNGCLKRDSIIITGVAAVVFDFPNDTTICNNETLLLSPGVANASYLWQDGSTQPIFTVTEPGNYRVQVTSLNSCVKTDSILVSYINAQQVFLGNDSILCFGKTLVLRADVPNATYLWNTGSTANNISVNQTGDYWIRVDNGSCTVKDSIRLVFSPPPNLFLGADTSLCEGEKLRLEPAIIDAAYHWQNGSSVSSYMVTGPGTYWLEVKKNGCIVSDTIRINYYTVPPVNLGPDTRFCTGDNAVLNATGNFTSYHWNNGETTASVTVSSPGDYSVIASTIDGCKAFDSLRVLSPYELPVVSLDHNSKLCIGETRVLNAGNGFVSYLWNDGSLGQNRVISGPGVYAVLVTDNNGCKASDTTKITQLLSPPSGFLPAGIDICTYGSIELSSLQNFTNYLWNNNAITRSIIVSQPGTYSLQVKDQNNCTGKDTTIVGLKDCMQGLFVPSAFTPNKDGRNDLFRPLLFGAIKKYSFSVYNRWGQIVFQTNEPGNGWDGRYGGKEQESNTFIWTCAYQLEGKPVKNEKGTVVLVR